MLVAMVQVVAFNIRQGFMHTVFLVWRLILIVVCQHHKSTFMLSYPQDQHNVDIAIAISTAIISITMSYFQYSFHVYAH